MYTSISKTGDLLSFSGEAGCPNNIRISEMRALCNDLCVRILSWIAALVGMRLVAADATLLPEGCRAIPAGHFNFDVNMVRWFGGKDGIAKAIIYQRFMGWIESNYSRGHNIRDGQAWSYNTYKQWAAEMPFFHQKTIEKHVRDMEAMGLLTSNQFDQRNGNGRKYYSSPLRLIDRPEQMLLWPESLTPMGGVEGSALYNTEPTLQKPSTPKKQTPTPARAHHAGGVQAEALEQDKLLHEKAILRRDAADLEDVDETRPAHTKTLTPVARSPFPDDTTERDEDTEEISVPQWAEKINQPAPDIEHLFAKHGDSLAGWYAYGEAQNSIKNPVGFALAKVKQGLKPPSSSPYVPDRYAEFIES